MLKGTTKKQRNNSMQDMTFIVISSYLFQSVLWWPSIWTIKIFIKSFSW